MEAQRKAKKGKKGLKPIKMKDEEILITTTSTSSYSKKEFGFKQQL